MLKKSIFMTLISVAILFQGCGDKPENTDKDKSEVAKANAILSSNEYILTSTDNQQFVVTKNGSDFILKGADGKVVMFDIFATWCPPCQAAATHITSLKTKYKDDLVVIGITIEENITNAKLQEFKKEYNADYTIVNSKRNRPLVFEIAKALDLGDRFPIPIMALYKDGKLINHYVGEVQEEFIESDIKRALHK